MLGPMLRFFSPAQLALPIVLSLLFAAGCGSAVGPAASDSAVIRDAAISIDAPGEGAGDFALGDVQPELALPDQGMDGLSIGDLAEGSDAAANDAMITQATVFYALAPTPDNISLRRVDTTNGVAPVTELGFSGLVEFVPLAPTGPQEFLVVDRSKPFALSSGTFTGIQLPNGATLHSFHRTLTASSGLLAVTPVGGQQVVAEFPGLYDDTISNKVALNSEGTIGAGVFQGDQAFLFRTDGSTFPTGGTSVQLETKEEVLQYRVDSLRIVGDQVFVVAVLKTGLRVLLAAPLDGTGLETIALPQVGGAAVAYLADFVHVSDDTSTIVVAGGSSSAVQDVVAVDTLTKVAVNASKNPTSILGPGGSFGSIEGRLATTNDGKWIAYVAHAGGVHELYLVASDGSALAKQISDSKAFSSDVSQLANLVWVDDDNLLFMAGSPGQGYDLFRWQKSVDVVSRLGGHGATSAPFLPELGFEPRGAWLSPNGAYFYWIEQATSQAARVIRALKLSTYQVSNISAPLQIGSAANDTAVCKADGMLYFSAAKDALVRVEEAWRVDQNGGKAAQAVSSLGSGNAWYSRDLWLAADCALLSFSAGQSFDKAHLWRLDTSTKAATQVTKLPKRLAPWRALSPDGLTMVFASGGQADALTLKALPAFGGSESTLDGQAGELRIFGAY